MFSEASVSLFTGVRQTPTGSRPLPRTQIPSEATPPPEADPPVLTSSGGHCGGRTTGMHSCLVIVKNRKWWIL